MPAFMAIIVQSKFWGKWVISTTAISTSKNLTSKTVSSNLTSTKRQLKRGKTGS